MLVARPMTMPPPPMINTQSGRADCAAIALVCATVMTAATGPIALATSFEPCANAMPQAVITIKITRGVEGGYLPIP